MIYDIIIKNGTVFDGAGLKPEKIDIGILKEKISKIGNLSKKKAKLTIEASNLYVTPGFIDPTTHSDTHWTLFLHPKQESFIRQGVTTILGGHGGISLAPLLKKELLESFSKWVDSSKINANWQTLEEFLKEAKKHPLALNFATLTGHETLRRNIQNNKTKKSKKEEVGAINNLFQKSLNSGAFGLSTNFGTHHAEIASEEEMLTLFKTTRRHNIISAHHLKDEGKNLLPSLSRLITLLRKSGAKGHIAHFKAIGRSAWQKFDESLNMIELARNQGVNLTCDFFPYTKTGSNLSSLLPSWLLSEKEEKILKILKEETHQQGIIEYLKNLTLHYDRMIIASTMRDSSSVGKSVSQISQSSGLSEEKSIISLLLINNLRVSIFNEAILQKNIEILAKKPYAMIASDGVGYEIEKVKNKKDLVHPRSFGSFPKVFSELVKEKNILKWEEAIYKMSGLPAETFGLKNRGVLKEGNYADIVILNPNTIKDKSTYEKPFQYPEGIEYVFVNGALTLAEGKMQEKVAGKILKKK